MYRAIEINRADIWDTALLELPTPHVLQCWAWGDLKGQTGWAAKRLLWIAEEIPTTLSSTPMSPRAAASILTRRLHSQLPIAVAYVPKGPLLDWSDSALVETVLTRLEQEARCSRAIFIKLDPDLRADTPLGNEVMAALVRRGWIPSSEQIQFRNTLVSDLTPDEEAILARMKPKWRYNIRLSERRGVSVRPGTLTDLPAFYAMYVETGQRDGFLVRPYAYYLAIWRRFLEEGLAHLLLAEVDGRPVAGLMLFRFGSTAWYFYGASTGQARELMPNHALQWAAMQWAKAVGCTRYDWWGAPEALDERDPMWGVYRFKAGFGGEFVSWIGAWDFPVRRSLYWLYRVMMPRALGLARRRQHLTTAAA